ncbi:MAG: transcriptional regulator [Candidatus Omnitrophota bacterium]
MTSENKPSRLARLIALAEAIRSRDGLSAAELMERFSISEQTFYQDLQDLCDSGVPIYFSEQGYRLNTLAFQSPFHLDRKESLLLMLGLSMLDESGAADRSELNALRAKIIPPAESRVDRLSDSASGGAPLKKVVDPRLIAFLNRAILGKRRVRINYRSRESDKPSWREFSPYAATHRNNSWYAIGFCHRRNEIRTFKIVRILDIIESPEPFREEADFDLEEYLLYSWNIMGGEPNIVVARFDRKVGPLILEKEIAHGRIWKEKGFVYLRTVVSGLDEFSWWIMQYGEHAEVLQPRELRRLLAKRCAKMAAKYSETIMRRSRRVKSCRNTSL